MSATSLDGHIWSPSTYTAPLSDDFPTDGDKLLRIIDVAWKSPESNGFALDDWQRQLIRHVLERYPDDHPKYPGQLRYRQVVISMGRQNGKTVLGGVFGLYGLLVHCDGPTVVGVAGDKEQADNLFKKVKYVVDRNPALAKRYKGTNTRGLYSRNPSLPASYVVKAGAEQGLQGFTISLCLADELHLWKPETWNALSFGASREESIIIGITTAGDTNSELLTGLYKTGHAAAAGEDDADERFGFFLWEAPQHLEITDPEAIKAANPAYACGRGDMDEAIRTVRNMPENQARRYRLNQFVTSEASWMPLSLWNRLEVGLMPERDNIVFAVDRAENWTYATITANRKDRVGNKIHTEVVCSLTNPSLEQLESVCTDLWGRYGGMGFIMESSNLKGLSDRLREQGVPTEYVTQGQMMNVSATAYSLISEGRIIHAGDDLLRYQMPRGVSKNIGDGWRVSRRESAGDVDSLLATILGIYAAETMKAPTMSLYVG